MRWRSAGEGLLEAVRTGGSGLQDVPYAYTIISTLVQFVKVKLSVIDKCHKEVQVF